MSKDRKVVAMPILALVIVFLALVVGSALGQEDRDGMRFRDYGYRSYDFSVLSLTTTTPDTLVFPWPTGWFRVYAVDDNVTMTASIVLDAAAMSTQDTVVVPAGQSFGFPIRADSLRFIVTDRTGSAETVYVLAVPHGSNIRIGD